MRVFLDTNVLASAFATRGICADILREVLAAHLLLASDQVLAELRRVLIGKFGVSSDLADEVAAFLRRAAVLVTPAAQVTAHLKDQDDLPILSAAVQGWADVVVTGDKELQRLTSVGDVRILSPREFWTEIAAR